MAIVMAMTPSRRHSIADTRNRLTTIVRAVERGAPIEITRRGEAVAVLLSIDEYRRLTAPPVDLVGALKKFRETADLEGLDADEVFARVRDRSPGRAAAW